MTRTGKTTPIEVFEENISDAHQLIDLARALSDYRKYRPRRERRDKLGSALGLPKRDWDKLDGVESAQAFVILKPNGGLTRAQFTEDALRPLLRQAVVALAAAVETYVFDRCVGLVSQALDRKELPERLASVPLSIGQVLKIEKEYKRRRWGYREVIETHLKDLASSNPGKIGMAMSTVGVTKVWPSVDGLRHKRRGTSEAEMKALAERRNAIAHSADWSGARRRALHISDVETYYATAKEIVEALESVIEDQCPTRRRAA